MPIKSSLKPGAMLSIYGAAAMLCPAPCSAQLTLASAVHLAQQHSPRVRAAELDVAKAQAGLAAVKDIYIPSMVTTAGAGASYGITPTVPTIFTFAAQSLVYSDQQRYYIRSARSTLVAAGLALTEARDQAEEDTVVAYLSLDEALAARAVLEEQLTLCTRLVAIVQDRLSAGVDSPLELNKARRGEIAVKLARLQLAGAILSLRSQLADLTGLQPESVFTSPDSVPPLPDSGSLQDMATSWAANPGLLAAEATADARMEHAQGDALYTWKPIVTFGAQYGRISPINNVSDFYNLHGNYNTANIGLAFELPLVDKVRKAGARVAKGDAGNARLDAANARIQLDERRSALEQLVPELALKLELAKVDYSISQEDLESEVTRAQAASSGSPASPKEEQGARIQERQRYLDVLDAQLQLAKVLVDYLRQAGRLASWIEQP